MSDESDKEMEELILNHYEETIKNIQWIKCSDRLPDLDTPVFGGWFYNDQFYWDCFVRVYDNVADDWVWARVEYIGSDNWLQDNEYQITHWMPLPQPPTGK
ncbi:DUF551 domain-containing protein [Xenorhabdus hominickii]|uniref:Phage protein n=1 Tax=Xenorhabdus hominickii TaxID=351679 RepID=A0A2G0PP32_XENHO|nr:DUF551 domain-containing protein [Xenorhabdus hominickii]AOM40209.1 hypothetical protein A9255_06220 [Xenorhabdus hominickii]PHM48715.1 phage protein [Xenorhabdus hominickii]